jgi:hypothetical protein
VSKYRKVDVKIWNDAKFVSLSERGKLVFLFLMTHPNLTIVGAMRATAPGLAAEIGIPLEGFREAFLEALSKGMAKVDKSAALIWLPNFLKYNKPESPNVVKAWPDAFDMLPECELKSQVFQHVKAFAEGMTEGFRKAFREVFGKGLPEDFAKTSPNQEQEQEQEQEQAEKTLVPVGTTPRPEEFASLWNSLRGPLPQVREFTDSRRRKIKVRMTQGLTLATFEEVIRRCLSTPFLVGENDRGWQADFDWLVENDTNMTKVMEGKYEHGGNGGNGAARTSGRTRTDGNFDAAREALARMAHLANCVHGGSETGGGEPADVHGICNPPEPIRPAGYLGSGDAPQLAAAI